MLISKGYIRENISLGAILLLLVLKKDHTWRICVDCKVINNITVKYRHCTYKLDDMLDDLHSSVLFSKIYLKSGYNKLEREKVMNEKLLLKLNMV
jgi:hypothetical protein